MVETADEFRERLYGLRITIATFAEETGVDVGTVSRWGKARNGLPGLQSFPKWVELLLVAWETRRSLANRLRRTSKPRRPYRKQETAHEKRDEIGTEGGGA